MSERTTLILADDHPTFRLGLKTAIDLAGEFEIVGEAANGREALRLIKQLRPDIAVVDWQMPEVNGLEVLRQVNREGFATRIIILTMHDDESLFREAMEFGVRGVVLKDNAVVDIVAGMRAVSAGDIYLSQSVSLALLKRTLLAARLRQENPGLDALTPTERNVLRLVANNRTSREIAADLGVSPHTIETHRRNICQKLGLRGSHSLLQFALRHQAHM